MAALFDATEAVTAAWLKEFDGGRAHVKTLAGRLNLPRPAQQVWQLFSAAMSELGDEPGKISTPDTYAAAFTAVETRYQATRQMALRADG